MFARRNALIALIAVLALVASIALIGTANPDPQADAESVATRAPATTATTTTTDPGPTAAEIKLLSDATRLIAIDRWVTTTNNAEAWYREAAEQARAAAARAEARRDAANAERRSTQPHPDAAPRAAQQGTGRCGGDLPPCYVMMRESGGNIRAKNPSSSASGKWQFLDSTWAGFGGYARASQAPESVQDAKARALWAGGAGCSHWNAC